MDNKKSYQFDINKVIVQDLDGIVLQTNLAQHLGNFIYTSLNTLEWLDISQAIHKGEIVAVSQDQLVILRQLYISDRCNLTIMCKVALEAYQNQLTSQEKSNK